MKNGTAAKRTPAVLYYGTCTDKQRTALTYALAARPDLPIVRPVWYAEHFPGGIPLALSASEPRSTSAARRNHLAATSCLAVVVISRPKYAQAVVRRFRHWGRRVFWYRLPNGTHDRDSLALVEVDTPAAVSRGLAALPKAGTFEPQLWDARRDEQEAIRATFTAPVSVWRYRWADRAHTRRMRAPFLSILPTEPRTPDSIPTYGWTEAATDTDADPSDICEWSKAEARREAREEWEARVAENSAPYRR